MVNALWTAVRNLPQSIKDSFVETGHAIGEGGVVALNSDIKAKLNTLYGTDVSRYQSAMLAIRTITAVTGAAGVAKVGGGVAEKTAQVISKKLEQEFARQFDLAACRT